MGGRRVFVERDGAVEVVPDRTLEARNLTVAIKNIARACGDEISEVQPLLDARLEDGSRVAAMFPPCAVAGPALTIRKFTPAIHAGGPGRIWARYRCRSLRHSWPRSSERAEHPHLRWNGTGKTTLLNALAAHIPDGDRIVVIEETAEIHLEKPNVLRLEARRAQAPLGQEAPLPPVTIADLLRAALRHRPDRILVGEVRGAEAFDLLQALEHRPPRQPEHDPRELSGAGIHAAGALRPDRQCRPAAPEHARGDRVGDSPGRSHRTGRVTSASDGARRRPGIRRECGSLRPRVSAQRAPRSGSSCSMKPQHARIGLPVLLLFMLSGCGGGGSGPTAPTGPQSFLAGTWRGTMTIQPNPTAPQPATPVTGAVTWTFEVVPQTNLQTFRTTIQSQNTWLPITLTMSTAMIPGNTPPAQISTQGEVPTRRADAERRLQASATQTRIASRQISPASIVRCPLLARVTLTKN